MSKVYLLLVLVFCLMLATSVSALTSVNSCTDLQNMQNNLAEDYILGSNIDCSSFGSFTPVGTLATPFTGTLDGNQNSITGLLVTGSGENRGLFGRSLGATFSNLNIDGNVEGNRFVGMLVGFSNGSTTISNVHVDGDVSGIFQEFDIDIGGMVGRHNGGLIENSSSAVTVIGRGPFTGGLVGSLKSGSTVSGSYSTGIVFGGNSTGGLIGSVSGNGHSDIFFCKCPFLPALLRSQCVSSMNNINFVYYVR